MQALRVHAFDQPLQLDTLSTPEPAPGQLRVRVAAVGISFFDMLIARGGYQWRPGLPFTVGSEFAGVVEAVGEGVSGWAIGEPVCGSSSIGAWCGQLCLPADGLFRAAPGAPLDEAAVLVMPYGTALYALRERGRLRAGETVLVLGATGSIGDAAVQLARHLGARVIAGVSGPAKAAAARASGAHEVVDVAAADWKDQVKALAGPRGVDIVVDPVGGDATDTAFRTLGWQGRHLVLGFASGRIGQLKANLTIVKGASLIGVDLRQFREREPEAAQRLFADVVALHRDGHVKPRVVARYPFAQHADAFARAADRATVGRAILTPTA